MAKSVKKTIGDYKFSTKIAKQQAIAAREESNSDTQVKKLCEFLNKNGENIVTLSSDNVELTDKVGELKRDIVNRDTTIKLQNKSNVSLRETIANLETKLSANDKIIKNKDVELEASVRINVAQSAVITDKNAKTSKLVAQVQEKKSKIYKLTEEVTASSIKADNLTNDLAIKTTRVEYLDKLVDKYEKNWFVSTFLKA